jgi:hypothetical protein
MIRRYTVSNITGCLNLLLDDPYHAYLHFSLTYLIQFQRRLARFGNLIFSDDNVSHTFRYFIRSTQTNILQLTIFGHIYFQ